MAELKRRALNLAIALDQFLWCVLTLGHANPDITLSAHAYMSEVHGKRWARIARPVIDWLFWPVDRNHCHNAYLAEINRRQLPADMRRA